MKKAISPLISSIALLGFAVILGMVVISWGNVYASEFQIISCDTASVAIVKVQEDYKICHKDSVVYFTAENDGSIAINGLLVDIFKDEDIQQIASEASMNVAEIKKVSVSYDSYSPSGDIQKIKIVPLIKLKNSEFLCPKKGFEVEQIVPCAK